jgi:hypothetical protein
MMFGTCAAAAVCMIVSLHDGSGLWIDRVYGFETELECGVAMETLVDRKTGRPVAPIKQILCRKNPDHRGQP